MPDCALIRRCYRRKLRGTFKGKISLKSRVDEREYRAVSTAALFPVDAWRHARVLVITVVAAVQVAILGFTSAENNRAGTAPVMRLPLASAWICSASIPGQLLATAFAVATRQNECPLDFVCCELVVVGHRGFLLGPGVRVLRRGAL